MTVPDLAQPVDGRSLLPLARGGPEEEGEAIGEYCAEMTPYPVFMIRRGRFKFIHSHRDPDLLFDLQEDPAELENVAESPAYRLVARSLSREARQRWDSEKVRRDVLAKQKQRHAIYSALQQGKRSTWDYQPGRDASQEYVRSHMDWNVAAQRTRVPPRGKESHLYR